MAGASCQESLTLWGGSLRLFSPPLRWMELNHSDNAPLTREEDRKSLWPNQPVSCRKLACQEFLFHDQMLTGSLISGISLNVRITPPSHYLLRTVASLREKGSSTGWVPLPGSLLTSLNRADAMKRDLISTVRGPRTGAFTCKEGSFFLSIHLLPLPHYTSNNWSFSASEMQMQTAAPAWFGREFSKHHRQKLLFSPPTNFSFVPLTSAEANLSQLSIISPTPSVTKRWNS